MIIVAATLAAAILVAAASIPSESSRAASERAGSNKPKPAILFPGADATLCGRTALIGAERNAALRRHGRERATWSFNAGDGFSSIPRQSLAPDSRGFGRPTTFFDPSELPSGDVTVRLRLKRRPSGPAAATKRHFLINSLPENGPIVTAPQALAQVGTTLAAPVSVGELGIKVEAVEGLQPGANLVIDSDTNLVDEAAANREVVTIETVGTEGPSGTGVSLAAPLNKSHSLGGSVYQLGETQLSAPLANDPDGTIVSYTWYLENEGVTLTGPSISHVFAGTEVIALTTTDDAGCERTTTVQYTIPQLTPTTDQPPIDYCDPLSVKVNHTGTSTNSWPADPGDGLPAGNVKLGRLHNAKLAVAFNFEATFTVLGDPAKCKEFQLIRTTRTVEFKDGTRRIWKNPAKGGITGKFHADDYTAPGTWKQHGRGTIGWIDDPRVYRDEAFGGTFNAKTNPVVKAKTQNYVLVAISGNEAPIPHVESGGPGETAYQRFRICAAWGTAGKASSFKTVIKGGPDAAEPKPKQDNGGSSGWQASKAKVSGC